MHKEQTSSQLKEEQGNAKFSLWDKRIKPDELKQVNAYHNNAGFRLMVQNRGGIRASSPRIDVHETKRIMATPAPTKRPITTEDDHVYSTPPHWSAKSSMVIDPAKRPNPSPSRLLSLSVIGFLSVSATLMWTRMKNIAAPAPPMGNC